MWQVGVSPHLVADITPKTLAQKRRREQRGRHQMSQSYLFVLLLQTAYCCCCILGRPTAGMVMDNHRFFGPLARRSSLSGTPLTIFDGGKVPSKKATIAPQTSDKTRSPASAVEPPMCGVHSTFGSLSTAKCRHNSRPGLGRKRKRLPTTWCMNIARRFKAHRELIERYGHFHSELKNEGRPTFTCTSRQHDLR